MTPAPRAAIYVRASTKRQDIDAQAAELAEEAQAMDLGPPIEYREKETATGRMERREYERLLRDAKDPARGWSDLLVWSVDRFSREARWERAVAAIHDLEARGVRIHFHRDPECGTPDGGAFIFAREVLLAIKLLLASQEAGTIQARTQLAMDALKAGARQTKSGKPVGRPRRVTPDKEARILALRAAGWAYRDIAGKVGLPMGTCRKVASKARGKSTALQTVGGEGGEPA